MNAYPEFVLVWILVTAVKKSVLVFVFRIHVVLS
jgi:hypothetical protein